MVDELDNIVLRHLRRVDERLERVEELLEHVVAWLNSLEDQVFGLRRDFVRREHRMDGFEGCLDRIERRLDVVDS